MGYYQNYKVVLQKQRRFEFLWELKDVLILFLLKQLDHNFY